MRGFTGQHLVDGSGEQVLAGRQGYGELALTAFRVFSLPRLYVFRASFFPALRASLPLYTRRRDASFGRRPGARGLGLAARG